MFWVVCCFIVVLLFFLLYNGYSKNQNKKTKIGDIPPFLENPLNFLGMLLYPLPLAIPEKTRLLLGISAMWSCINYTPWKFQNQKPRLLEITIFFSYHTWKIYVLFGNPVFYFFDTPRNFMSSNLSPVSFFSWNKLETFFATSY